MKIIQVVGRNCLIKLDTKCGYGSLEMVSEIISREEVMMLLSFSVKNWMSFRDETTFSMVASREKQHGERVSRVNKYSLRILPVAAIFGGNASGKSNFIKALSFVQSMVVNDYKTREHIPVTPFFLESRYINEPTTFSFELLINETIYEFSFSMIREKVIEEKIINITSRSSKIVYHRNADSQDLYSSDYFGKKDGFLDYVIRGTYSNQLVIRNICNLNIESFQPKYRAFSKCLQDVYGWFANDLEIIIPNTRNTAFEAFYNEHNALYDEVSDLFRRLDTGIVGFDAIKVPKSYDITPKREEEDYGASYGECRESVINYVRCPGKEYMMPDKEEVFQNRKLTPIHRGKQGRELPLALVNESEGIHRLIDLVPAFVMLHEKIKNKIFFIDEIDRSLHTVVTQGLIQYFLDSCSAENRSQLIFTTHDLLLMDQEMVRRDEIWVTERNNDGSSELYSFSEFKDVRYDKDIRKSYLQGRLGGVPRISFDIY